MTTCRALSGSFTMGSAICSLDSSTRAVVKFGALFLACTLVFFMLFEVYADLVTRIYVWSISYLASALLRGFGTRPEMVMDLQAAACTLWVGGSAYEITQGCTGLFTSALFVSGIIAYPATLNKKLIGITIGIPAFFVFGTFRVVIMGLVAVIAPSRIEIFHIDIMAIANLGFAMFVWVYWFQEVVKVEEPRSVSG
jgi:exosortase/archaeosortase family protein